MTSLVMAASIGKGDWPWPTTACAASSPEVNSVASTAQAITRLRIIGRPPGTGRPRPIDRRDRPWLAPQYHVVRRRRRRLERDSCFGTPGRAAVGGRSDAHDALENAREM